MFNLLGVVYYLSSLRFAGRWVEFVIPPFYTLEFLIPLSQKFNPFRVAISNHSFPNPRLHRGLFMVRSFQDHKTDVFKNRLQIIIYRPQSGQTMNNLSAAAEPWVQPMVNEYGINRTTPKVVEHF